MPRLPLVEGLHNDDGVNRRRSGPQMLAGWLKQKTARERASVDSAVLKYSAWKICV